MAANPLKPDSPPIPGDLIEPLRDASRKLVREWGFLQPTFAGSRFSPGAVHCLIEIGDRKVRRFADLCNELKVSRRQLLQLLSELLSHGSIAIDIAGPADAPEATYSLTPAGAQALSAINAYAHNQVTKALATAHPDAAADIAAAFHLYAAALERVRLTESVSTPDDSRAVSPELAPLPAVPHPVVTINRGYRPALLARTLELHMNYYCRTVGWGVEFETGLGATLSNLISRLDRPVNEAWTAIQSIPAKEPGLPSEERVVGVIFIDGEIPGREGSSRLRAFIVDESARGLGVGTKLIKEAMAFVREKGFVECGLSTMRQLEAARKLYEAEGFLPVSEEWKETWGKRVLEMEYAWFRSGQGRG